MYHNLYSFTWKILMLWSFELFINKTTMCKYKSFSQYMSFYSTKNLEVKSRRMGSVYLSFKWNSKLYYTLISNVWEIDDPFPHKYLASLDFSHSTDYVVVFHCDF